jgi:hypothetical protein
MPYFKQIYMDSVPDNNKIIIDNNDLVVQVPLPADFGMTVGSEFTTPFDTGGLSGMYQKAAAVAGFSQKLGLSMKSLYANPSPTEISFECELVAYYSAVDEVVKPAIALMLMAVGKRVTGRSVEHKMNMLFGKVDKAAGTNTRAIDTSSFGFGDGDDGESKIDKALELIKVIESPNKCSIQFGNVLTIEDKAWMTSAAPQFSNVLDSGGMPMSATVSLTFTVEEHPIDEDIMNYFGDI